MIHRKYGESVSIAHFERMLGELSTLEKPHLDLIDLDKALLDAYEEYVKRKDERDEERSNLRVCTNIPNVAAALDKAKEIAY
jgi:hypothetical protein